VPFGTQTPQGTQNQGTQGQGPQGQDNTDAGGSASAFGNTEKPGGRQLQQAPASFTMPGFYGRGPQTYTVGEGRLARPHFRFSGTVALGYDDNVLSTPTHGLSVPTQKVDVLESPGSPAHSEFVLIPSGNPAVPASVQSVEFPAVAPKFRTVTIPGVPAAERIASWVTRTNGKWDVQFASRRSLFTFDLGGGVDYYWNRPGTKADYTGNVSMVYLRRLSGRAQFTIALDSSYQSQPDFSQPNVPTSNNVGSYLTTNLKADLSYRLTPRFSSVTSVNYNSVAYQEQQQQNADFATTTFGTELRYLFSPRLTLLGELRYSSDVHQNDAQLDTSTYYVLAGGELTLSRRFNASLRLGEAVEKFKTGGATNSAPYAEATLNYRLGPATSLGWNARYGYEEAGAPNTRNIVARSGLQLTQVFSPRFQGVLGVNVLRSTVTTTSTVSDVVTSADSSSSGSTSSAAGGSTAATSGSTSTTTAASTATTPSKTTTPSTHEVTLETVQDTIDASLGFYYTLDRHWSFNLTYSYTMAIGPVNTADYNRQRVFLGATYQF
jgi:hypothetical protein